MVKRKEQSKVTNALLWIAQILLAGTLIWAGATKLFEPTQKLAEMWPWTANNPGLVKLTAVLDMLAGAGLVLPMLLRVAPDLTIYAAYGTIALMIAAMGFHIIRGEAPQIGINILIAVIAGLIAWGRANMR